MFTRIWKLVLKELRQLFRDRILAPMVTLGCVLELVMVGYSTSAGIHNLPTAVVDLDQTAQSRAVVTSIKNVDTFAIKQYPDSIDDLIPLLDKGAVSVGIVIPPGFSNKLGNANSSPPQVQIIVDGSEPGAAEAALLSAQGAILAYGQEVVFQESTLSNGMLIDSDVRVRYNEELKESNYTVPSEMGFMLAAITMMVASLGLARERELGTMEQLMVTPLRPFELIIGKAIPAILLGYVVFLLMLAISLVGFGVPMRGSWPLLLAIAAFYLFVELGWGIMASAVSKNQLQALLLVFIFIMVEMVFSGYAFPVENMPRALQIASNLFPIKHWLLIFRSILLKGAGPWAYWQELAALAILGTGITSMTVFILSRQQYA